jgi:hypothetical protein
MKRSFYLRASVCLLFCVVSEYGIAQVPANTAAERVTDTAMTFVPAAADDAGRGSHYYAGALTLWFAIRWCMTCSATASFFFE